MEDIILNSWDSLKYSLYNQIYHDIIIDGYTLSPLEYVKDALDYFIQIEKYEKCIILKNYLEK